MIAQPPQATPLVPGVSVVIPAYNHQSYVGATLASIAALQPEVVEVIVVDDASRDGTFSVAKESAEKLALPARFFQHSANKGICATLNEGLREVRTEFVMFLASDDTVPCDKLQNQLGFLQSHPEFVAVYADMLVMAADGSPLRVDRGLDRTIGVAPESRIGEMRFERVLLGQTGTSIQSGLFRTSAVREVGGFDESLRHEDLDLTLRLLTRSRIAYQYRVGACYRTNPAGTNRAFRVLESDYERILKKHQGHANSLNLSWSSIEAAIALRKANHRANVDERLSAIGWALRALPVRAMRRPALEVIARMAAPQIVRRAVRLLRARTK